MTLYECQCFTWPFLPVWLCLLPRSKVTKEGDLNNGHKGGQKWLENKEGGISQRLRLLVIQERKERKDFVHVKAFNRSICSATYEHTTALTAGPARWQMVSYRKWHNRKQHQRMHCDSAYRSDDDNTGQEFSLRCERSDGLTHKIKTERLTQGFTVLTNTPGGTAELQLNQIWLSWAGGKAQNQIISTFQSKPFSSVLNTDRQQRSWL